jgi:peptidoglycan/LPS O-acetylase OafA/YrhL
VRAPRVPHLQRIQVLRFVAASMVLAGHAQHQVQQVAGIDLSSYRMLPNPAFYAGGVDVFFVLSGFIMVTICRTSFGTPGASGEFLLRRVARIAPPYWVFTTAMICATLLFPQHVAHGRWSADHMLASYLFIPTRNAYGDLYPVLVLGWTLEFEMLFYLMFAIGLRWPRARGLAFIFGAVAALGGLGALFGPTSGPFAFWCNPIVFEFLFGMLVAGAHATGWRCAPRWGAALLAVGIVLLYAGSARSDPDPFWLPRAFWMGLPASLVCAAAALTREPATAGWAGRGLARAGDASYVLYLSHPFTLTTFSLLAVRLGLGDPWLYLALACASCVVVAMALHQTIERPFVAMLNARITRSFRTLPPVPARIVHDSKGR